MKALLFGASGGLAGALGRQLLQTGWQVDLVTRDERRGVVEAAFAEPLSRGAARLLVAPSRYADFAPDTHHDAIFFTQALFEVEPLAQADAGRIEAQLQVGLHDPILLTRTLLQPAAAEAAPRRDFCYVGSTSAYAGFRNTAVYCTVKHGLLGFVRAMNDEYAPTDTRFWLFSMGTMQTAMGAKVRGQDPASFLSADDVAARICNAITNRSNVFEPEVILRRRTIRLVDE